MLCAAEGRLLPGRSSLGARGPSPPGSARHCEEATPAPRPGDLGGARSTGCAGGSSRTREVLTTPLEDLVRGRRPLDAARPRVRRGGAARRRHGAARGGGGHGGAARPQRRDRVRGAAGDARRAARGDPARPRAAGRSRALLGAAVGGLRGRGQRRRARPPPSASWPRPGRGEGRSVLLCAADTFRAAAAEQLEVWAERAGAAFHRGAEGADPSAVLTDALRAARAPGARRRARGHRGAAPHQGEPDGGARQDGPRGRPRGPGRAPRDAARARRDRRRQRARPGARVRQGRRA